MVEDRRRVFSEGGLGRGVRGGRGGWWCLGYEVCFVKLKSVIFLSFSFLSPFLFPFFFSFFPSPPPQCLPSFVLISLLTLTLPLSPSFCLFSLHSDSLSLSSFSFISPSFSLYLSTWKVSTHTYSSFHTLYICEALHIFVSSIISLFVISFLVSAIHSYTSEEVRYSSLLFHINLIFVLNCSRLVKRGNVASVGCPSRGSFTLQAKGYLWTICCSLRGDRNGHR